MPAWDQCDAIAQIATFGEAVRYMPQSGPPRVVMAVLERRRSTQATEGGLFRLRSARILVLRDATNEPLGGIDEPEVGDELQIVGETDVFRFSGDVLDENAFAWKLDFNSEQTDRLGGSVEAR